MGGTIAAMIQFARFTAGWLAATSNGSASSPAAAAATPVASDHHNAAAVASSASASTNATKTSTRPVWLNDPSQARTPRRALAERSRSSRPGPTRL